MIFTDVHFMVSQMLSWGLDHLTYCLGFTWLRLELKIGKHAVLDHVSEPK